MSKPREAVVLPFVHHSTSPKTCTRKRVPCKSVPQPTQKGLTLSSPSPTNSPMCNLCQRVVLASPEARRVLEQFINGLLDEDTHESAQPGTGS